MSALIGVRLTVSTAALVITGLAAGVSESAEPPRVIVRGSIESSADVADTQISLETLEPVASESLERLADHVGNLHVSDSGAGSFGDLLGVRGLSNTPYFSDPAVTVYLDDLPLAGGFTYPTSTLGFLDATVLRGVQGTAFGRGGEGGVILLSSAEALRSSVGEVSSSALLRLGRGSFASSTAAFQGRVESAGSFDASLRGSYNARDGYIRNVELDQRVDDQKSETLSARARWWATDTAQFTAQLFSNRQRNGAQPLVPLEGPLFTVERNREGRIDSDFVGVALKGEFRTSWGRLTTVTSRTSWSLDPYDNQLVLPPPLDSTIHQKRHASNEELRLSSQNWTVGTWVSIDDTVGQVDRAIAGLFPIEASVFQLDSRTGALFGEYTWTLPRNWRVTGGLRAETVRRKLDRMQTVPSSDRFTDRESFDSLTPKIMFLRTLAPRTTLQFTLARGSRPGGWSAYTGNASLAPFDPETVTSVEMAFVTSGTDDRLRLATRVFGYRIRNYQIERSFSETDYLVVNAPRARSVGAEVEGAWQITSSLTLTSAIGTTHATLREFSDPFTGVSYAGNRVPNAPSYEGSLAVTYRTPRGWFAVAEANATGRVFYDESESAVFSQKSRATVAARLGFDADAWRVMLSGDNLTDERYYSLVVPGVAHAVPGAPRSYGLEVAVRIQ